MRVRFDVGVVLNWGFKMIYMIVALGKVYS